MLCRRIRNPNHGRPVMDQTRLEVLRPSRKAKGRPEDTYDHFNQSGYEAGASVPN
jgi:hypothetical protein